LTSACKKKTLENIFCLMNKRVNLMVGLWYNISMTPFTITWYRDKVFMKIFLDLLTYTVCGIIFKATIKKNCWNFIFGSFHPQHLPTLYKKKEWILLLLIILFYKNNFNVLNLEFDSFSALMTSGSVPHVIYISVQKRKIIITPLKTWKKNIT